PISKGNFVVMPKELKNVFDSSLKILFFPQNLGGFFLCFSSFVDRKGVNIVGYFMVLQ
ncbi:hypothetical protein MKW92_038997, partial [Papaver armeniacum]